MLRCFTILLFITIGLVSGFDQPLEPSPSSSASQSKTSSEHSSSTAEQTTTTSTHSISPTPSSSTPPPSSSINATTKPTTKPTPKPTTKPTPKPTTKPRQPGGDYSVKDGKNYCLLARLDVMVMVHYESEGNDNKTTKETATIHMPFDKEKFSTNGSKCGSAPVLEISWPKSSPMYHFQMKFIGSNKNAADNSSEWRVSEMTLMVTTKDNPAFTNATEDKIPISVSNKTELSGLGASTKGYYLCAANRTYPSPNGQLFLKYVKLQPFQVQANSTEQFGKEFNCESAAPTAAPKKDDNNIVPIAVGCALAGLVLIVLIAYIIGRRKSQRGYEKV